MPRHKLNRFNKRAFRDALRERQREEFRRAAENMRDTVSAAILKRVREEWADKQDDMEVLSRYGVASTITGGNLRVYNPDTRRYDEVFGLELETGLMYPGTNPYWHGHCREDDEDYPALLECIQTRRNFEQAQRDRRDELDEFMKNTISVAKVKQAFPEIADTTLMAEPERKEAA